MSKLQKTLVLLKPCTLQRGLAGEIISLEGVDAVDAVRALTGPTNGRLAPAGTIRGNYCVSFQENIVHASDSPETAAIELARFFKPEEMFEWRPDIFNWLYACDEF